MTTQSNQAVFAAVRKASRTLAAIPAGKIDDMLRHLADRVVAETDFLLAANARDLARMDPSNPKYDRLQLSAERIAGIASDMRDVAALPSPLGRILSETIRPNGLKIKKISVPMGVIGMIYEARPNVTLDVFSLCVKSGNACILKGGSDASDSNTAIMSVIHRVLEEEGFDRDIVALLPSDRSATAELLTARGFVDLLIPRGSQSLINYVCENAKIPVIETGAGVVHVYFDEFGDRDKGRAVITNSKTRRVSVCNALECLLVHASRLQDLPYLLQDLPARHVVLYADARSEAALRGVYPDDLLFPADESCYGREFLDYKMAIRTVDSIDEAVEHTYRYGTKHSESIVSENADRIQTYYDRVDAAVVYSNAATSFTDGAQFGLGAEIGISTQKLHARGPMGLCELTSYKWLVAGNGQTRP
ncbi:MAG: glutamate-5-semialdehyde dehydrogenase [Bacteroidales bacterium]|nr:glutamate-5-semialdehyde dehydrogenase [Bacteroidales bacterium]